MLLNTKETPPKKAFFFFFFCFLAGNLHSYIWDKTSKMELKGVTSGHTSLRWYVTQSLT